MREIAFRFCSIEVGSIADLFNGQKIREIERLFMNSAMDIRSERGELAKMWEIGRRVCRGGAIFVKGFVAIRYFFNVGRVLEREVSSGGSF
jgi:hypothetical protein